MNTAQHSTLVNRVCDLARQYYSDEHTSIYDLTKRSGYFELYASIGVQDLAQEFESRPEAMRFWLQYSEDKRTTGGWFVFKELLGYRVVSRFGGREVSGSYRNAVDACAMYVKNELEDIRLS